MFVYPFTQADYKLDTGWLLIFDNAIDSPGLKTYWPACDHGAIILTTQVSDLLHRASSTINLDPFSRDDGSALLLSHINPITTRQGRTHDSTEDAKDICDEVDGLPLLLVGLAGYITHSHRSIHDVLQLFQNSSREEARRIMSNSSTASTTFQYERPMRMVYDLAFDELSPVAQSFLHIIAMLSPDSILESLLLVNVDDDLLFNFLTSVDRSR